MVIGMMAFMAAGPGAVRQIVTLDFAGCDPLLVVQAKCALALVCSAVRY
jgi:hypothetical protein